jgi:hypothetical protein
MLSDGDGYRRDHLRALAQRVDQKTAYHRIEKRARARARCGLKRKNGKFWSIRFALKWRATLNEDGQYCFAVAL